MGSRLTDLGHLSELAGFNFSDEQLAAITAPLQPGVIIAGAGTGKTTVMAARVVWLIGTGQVRPDQILGLTFTRKAAGQLGQRITQALMNLDVGEESADVTVATYDSFAGRLVADHGMNIGIDTDARLITGAIRFQLAARVISFTQRKVDRLRQLSEDTVVERLLELDSALQSHLCSLETLRVHHETLKETIRLAPKLSAPLANLLECDEERIELADLVDDYRHYKSLMGVVEFADQMAFATRIVREVASVPPLIREQYRAVLLDEYQDTSAAQATLLQALFSGADSKSGRGHPVTAVGDPFQAIYGWRGAAASNIGRFATMFPCVDGTPASSYPLTVNRRSGPRILASANALAEPLRAQGGFVGGFLSAPAESDDGEVYASTFETKDAEIAWLADKIVDIHRRGTVDQWSQIGVLARRNADLVKVFDALTQRDVPVEIVGLGGLLNLPEIADVVAMLKLCIDPTANAEAALLLTGSRWQIPTNEVAALAQHARCLVSLRAPSDRTIHELLMELRESPDKAESASLIEAAENADDLQFSPEIKERLTAFAEELTILRAHIDEPVPEFVQRVIRMLGIDVEVRSDPERYGAGRAQQLAHFVNVVGEFTDVDGRTSLAGLVSYFDAEMSRGDGLEQVSPNAEDSVKILTIHRAKGLEWDVVFLPFLVDKVFPSSVVTDDWVRKASTIPASLRGDRDSVPQIREYTAAGLDDYHAELGAELRLSEDRLAYVAATRARRTIYASGHVWSSGNVAPRERSPYLEVFINEAQQQNRVGEIAVQADKDQLNPCNSLDSDFTWPSQCDEDYAFRLHEAAQVVRDVMSGKNGDDRNGLHVEELVQIEKWAREAELLVSAERERRRPSQAGIPVSLSATEFMTAVRNPERYARELLRPMPRSASASASLGSRFHQWVERRFALRSLLEPELDFEHNLEESEEDSALTELTTAFLVGPYAALIPDRVEVPFILVLGQHQVRGRIDAVYLLPDDANYRYQVVDWKTTTNPADSLQLACYRAAWAEAKGLPADQVDAVFYYVRTGKIVRPAALPTIDELKVLVAGEMMPKSR